VVGRSARHRGNPSPPQKLYPIDEKPGDIVERFFPEIVRPLLNGQVRSLAMWEAYVHSGAPTVSSRLSRHAMFGRLARWRIGGAVWYLDCELAEGYANVTSAGSVRGRAAAAFPPSRDGQRRSDRALNGKSPQCPTIKLP